MFDWIRSLFVKIKRPKSLTAKAASCPDCGEVFFTCPECGCQHESQYEANVCRDWDVIFGSNRHAHIKIHNNP